MSGSPVGWKGHQQTLVNREISLPITAQGYRIGLFMLWLVAVNLRTGLIGVGPLLPRLTDDLSLSSTEGSVLVALPTALMGIAALPGGRMADRLGSRMTISIGLAIVALAGGLRAVTPDYPLLILLTVVFGIGVGITQPAMPRMSRGLLPGNVGIATGILTCGLFIGAVLAAFLTVPLLISEGDGGWRRALATWGILGLVSLAVWFVSLKHWQLPQPMRLTQHAAAALDAAIGWTPWRNRAAWVVAIVFAGQGLAYYLLVAWLPSVYDEVGTPEDKTTLLYAIFTLMTFPAMVGLPPLSDRIGSRRIPVLLASILFLIGSLGLAFAIDAPILMWVWPALAALGVAGLFGMGLLMPTDVAPPGHMGATAGMVLGVGYAGSAIGPVLGGVIRDATGSFETALMLLPLLAVGLIALSFFVPQPRRANF